MPPRQLEIPALEAPTSGSAAQKVRLHGFGAKGAGQRATDRHGAEVACSRRPPCTLRSHPDQSCPNGSGKLLA